MRSFYTTKLVICQQDKVTNIKILRFVFSFGHSDIVLTGPIGQLVIPFGCETAQVSAVIVDGVQLHGSV
jgi:hypothetical protein